MQKASVGKVLKLFISQQRNPKRLNQNKITLDTKGVLDDKFYEKNINRSVLIVSKDSYNLAQQNDIDINYGQLGENILIDYKLYHLDVGTQIKIGDVLLEISQECTLCKSLSNVNNKLPKLLKEDRGVFAKVIIGGIVQKGDAVYIF